MAKAKSKFILINFVDLQSVFFFILIVLDNTAHLSQGLDTVDNLGVKC